MSIEIDPRELCFQRPLTTEVSQTLNITNPNSTAVAFKVKTTAPKQYCVRPNSGRIEPGGNVKVIVLLQAMKEEPPLDARCKDKFLVQSVAITGSIDSSDGEVTCQSIESAEKTAIKETRIRVVYSDPQPGTRLVVNNSDKVIKSAVSSTASNDSEGAPSSHSIRRSPSPEITRSSDNRTSNRQTFGISSSIDTAQSSPQANILPLMSSHEHLPIKLKKTEETKANQTQKENKQQHEGSNEEIVIDATMKLDHGMQHGPQGVPLQTVAVLCLMSFLLAYILF
ncbi:Vesicle-associated membrane protein-associated protein A [Golovinomyces cichoracearum]|uniref:Vesicle-associated membrane protein-associated protein A n=1 Tax=Golovinomyces cichoracearum TaxID=62708 RepID=A0A420IKI3_9PEZI|nr:Vesicle-associated membrane protein-associated protein A [Golovinomyces cichoracearum]